MFIKKLFLSLVFLFPSLLIKSQCSIEQNTASNAISVSTTESIGQSFVACDAAYLDSIKVNISNLSMASVQLKMTIVQGINTTQNIIHTQLVKVENNGMLIIPIEKKVFVKSGTTYAFSLIGIGGSGNIDFAQTLGDLYPAGQLIRNNVSLSSFDLVFGVYISEKPFIPTLSQWGLLLFGIIVLSLGIFIVRKLPVQ